MSEIRFSIPDGILADFCHKHQVARLALFGSVLRDDFEPGSDVDVLIEFQPGCRVGLLRFAAMQNELSDLIGRQVDLNTPAGLSPYFRDQVLAEAETRYVAA